jgi:multidrug efflux pump subunit AcrB
MWLVRLALNRPYTFIVLAILILIIGLVAIRRTPTDIFPNIDIPVVSVVWGYSGMPPDQMADFITSVFERAVTTTVNDVEHIESQSLLGVSVTKIFFQKTVNVSTALSQVTAISQTLLRLLPPGTQPPLVLSYNASTVPVLQLILSSNSLSEAQLYDLGNNFIRTQLANIQGAALPFPYGGKTRQIMVDLNQPAMQAFNVSPQDVNNAILNQNLILPAGTEKVGNYEYVVKLNASPTDALDLNNVPIKAFNGGLLYIRDVAHVRDGFAPQTNIVRVNNQRAVMMSIQKTGNASTLKIVDSLKALLPRVRDSMPPALQISLSADQSIFVKAAVQNIINEGFIAAALTTLMILLFLGNLRSTFTIISSIPLSILASLVTLAALGETINIMTLGGLALAIGILVDDATVTIENINYNLEQGKELKQAILDGAQQIATPAFVSTLSICIVFVPMFFLTGVSHYLFLPLAQAVVFAILFSYFLSRTLVPTLAMYWLPKKIDHSESHPSNFFNNIHEKFATRFESFRSSYRNLLHKSLNNSKQLLIIFALFMIGSLLLLFPWVGSNFFPVTNTGQIKLHVRAHTGTRIEETARLCDEVDSVVRKIIPRQSLASIIHNIGLPVSGINLSYSTSAPIGPQDADILISLNKGSAFKYSRELRLALIKAFPSVSFSFLPADIVNQTLNFGLPSPVDIQVVGLNLTANKQYADQLLLEIKKIPGIVDARIQQAFDYPQFFVNADRSLSKEFNFNQSDIAANMLISLSGGFQTTPTFWRSPQGITYPIVAQTPQYQLSSLDALRNIPLANSMNASQILGAVSSVARGVTSAVVSHYNAQPVIDIYAGIEETDLGSVASKINQMIENTKKQLPKGSLVIIRGQIETQQISFRSLYAGLFFSIIFVYLLMVVNFQSWVDPFIIICTLPFALAGITWLFFLTLTPLSVPALTGVIMCMGIATANSILLISFAKQDLDNGQSPLEAALNAGTTRIRPILMTALAMMIGMLPMALGLGEGGEQNAPLGRAVIGGLAFSTVATLFFVPTLFYVIYRKKREANDVR